MSADWKPGDLAVCVDASGCQGCGEKSSLVRGATYIVDTVAYCPWAGLGLTLVGVSASENDCHLAGFGAHRFRKVVSDKREACEEEFLTLLKRSKQEARA